MSRQDFLELDEAEQSTFIAKAIHMIRTCDTAFDKVNLVVETGEDIGAFDKVKIGAREVYRDEAALID
jgi:hypothetical protein